MNSTSHCHERERQALLKFRSSFKYTSLGQLGSWKGLNCCHWKGVGCDFISGHVIKLDLRRPCSLHYHISRYFAFYNYTLEAEALDPSLLELEHLTYLDLSGNYFYGSHIPKVLGFMKQLRYLNLSDSDFSGMIPHHLSNLSNLQVLDLSHDWTYLYANDMGWVSKLSSLRHIAMNYVSLGKAHNLFQVLSMLPSLLQAEFSYCGITNVHVTHASMNSIFLPNIELLGLSNNDLHGSIPDTLQNMTSLRELDLSGNSISSIPHWLGNFHSLIHLDLSRNSFNEIKTQN